MQLSYNLIKNKTERVAEEKEIKTNYISKLEKVEIENIEKFNDNDISKSYENIGINIVKKAKIEAENIVMDSRRISVEIEKEAYEKGYVQGKENGGNNWKYS